MTGPATTSRSLLLACWLAAAAAHAGPAPGALAEEARALGTAAVSADNERRLNRIVSELSARRGDPQARALLEELAGREPQVRVRHSEGDALIPLVDVGAAARATLRNWDRQSAFDRAMATGRAAHPGLVAQYFAADDNARNGILDAVAHMEPASLLPYRHEIQAALGQTGCDALAATAALALDDDDLAMLVIAGGTDRVVQRLIAQLPHGFSDTTALRLLQAALQRAPLASMALFRIDTLPSKAADETIWASLHDAELGATAAAVLARRSDRATIRRLIGLMESARAPLTRQRARLALTLSADPDARAAARNRPATP